jgi:predicted unusual protein kinase regulating ubiquinone biosynthesis (AarF/ABC1/UbiB family)
VNHFGRTHRTLRVWRLTARNAVRFGWHRLRRPFAANDRRVELDDRFAIRTSADVARELGQMKGALMKLGQLMSFVLEALPEDAQAALSTLQSDAPPMSPDAAAVVIAEEFGSSPEHLFLDWQREPIAAASIGQVHRAVTHHGDDVAVKVQYPGVGDAIESDLDNAEALYRLVGMFALKGLDTKGLVDELRARMRDELDYRLEAANQTELADAFAGHPNVRIPRVVAATSGRRVLTTEWVDGIGFDQFLATAPVDARQRAGEAIWRFAHYAIHCVRAFNADPHPGNYRFSADGGVTFLDFGLVKRWTPGEWESLRPTLDAMLVHRDPQLLVTTMEVAGFLRPHHGLDAVEVYSYVSAPYLPYLSERFCFTRLFLRESLGAVLDVKGPHSHVIEQLNLPTSFVMLNRVVWGVSAILGKLEVEAPWRQMLLEYLVDGPPATPMGAAERAWRTSTSSR